MRRVDFSPALLAARSSLKAMARPALREPAPLVFFVRAFTVANGDSIGLVVRRWTQCSAGKSKKVSSRS